MTEDWDRRGRDDRFERLRAPHIGPAWPELGGDEAKLDYKALVDRVVESHRAVLATLEADVRGPESALELATVRRQERAVRERFGPIAEGSAFERHKKESERLRRERERIVMGLQPREPRPQLDPPLVTRGGIIYVPPAFEHASGLDDVAAARLVAGGFRSVGAFLRAPNEELARLLALSVETVERAKRDMDLTRLPQIDEGAADLLRLLGYSSVSRLAIADPELLGREVDRVVKRYRLLRRPAVLSSQSGRRRLIAAAEARGG